MSRNDSRKVANSAGPPASLVAGSGSRLRMRRVQSSTSSSGPEKPPERIVPMIATMRSMAIVMTASSHAEIALRLAAAATDWFRSVAYPTSALS